MCYCAEVGQFQGHALSESLSPVHSPIVCQQVKGPALMTGRYKFPSGQQNIETTSPHSQPKNLTYIREREGLRESTWNLHIQWTNHVEFPVPGGSESYLLMGSKKNSFL